MADEADTEAVRLTLEEVRLLARSVLSAAGLRGGHVEAVAETIVAEERGDCGAYGVCRLMMCHRTIRAGKVNVDAVPAVRSKMASPPWRSTTARTSAHFTALRPEIEVLARSGLVALACTPSHAWVAPTGRRARCSAPIP